MKNIIDKFTRMGIDISYIAIDRMAQDSRHLYKEGANKMLLSDARKLSDEELRKILSSLGISLTREEMKEYCENYPSSQEIAIHFYNKYHVKDSLSDFCWLSFTVLWERWYPDIPHLESLDDKMQEGYAVRHGLENTDKVVSIWREYWKDAKWFMKKWNVASIRDFDNMFPQYQFVFNWCQDYDETLHNSAVGNKSYNEEHILFCSEIIPLLEADSLTIQNMRRSIAECHFNLGKHEVTDSLYRQWLTDDPKWSWGWIGWADRYSFYKKASTNNLPKAERILKEGLAVNGINDKEIILERLLEIYKEMGNEDGIRGVTMDIANLKQEPKPVNKSEISPLVSDGKGIKRPGRNEPCICGSGKKYKKCCG